MSEELQPVAWMYSNKRREEVFAQPNRANMDPRYWREEPLYTFKQLQGFNRLDDRPLTSNQFDYHETGNLSDKRKGENGMKIGDSVRKIKGYPFPGVIVADFTNYKGERRVVVEARHPDILGCLHIYNPDQLEVVK